MRSLLEERSIVDPSWIVMRLSNSLQSGILLLNGRMISQREYRVFLNCFSCFILLSKRSIIVENRVIRFQPDRLVIKSEILEHELRIWNSGVVKKFRSLLDLALNLHIEESSLHYILYHLFRCNSCHKSEFQYKYNKMSDKASFFLIIHDSRSRFGPAVDWLKLSDWFSQRLISASLIFICVERDF